jgi:transcriptional regulator with XRE-family HTH domain
MYPNLKMQVWSSRIRQYRLAQLVGIHESLLSKILNGSRHPSSVTRAKIAEALGTDEDWLFSEEYLPPPAVKKKEKAVGSDSA